MTNPDLGEAVNVIQAEPVGRGRIIRLSDVVQRPGERVFVSKPEDCVLYVGVKISDSSQMGNRCYFIDCELGDRVTVGRAAYFGSGTLIGSNVDIGSAARFGESTRVGNMARMCVGARFDINSQVGRNSVFKNGAHFRHGAHFGDNVAFGEGAVFGSNTKFGDKARFDYDPIFDKEGLRFGDGCVVYVNNGGNDEPLPLETYLALTKQK